MKDLIVTPLGLRMANKTLPCVVGKNGVSKFKNMFRCMKEGDWEGASFQMKDSRWHKQTTNRCEELASIVANYKE